MTEIRVHSSAAACTRSRLRTCLAAVTALSVSGAAAPALGLQRPRPIPTPRSVLGFEPGTDRRLVGWEPIVEYFRRLDAASDRVLVRELGRTTNGAPFIVAFISSPANLARLTSFRETQRRLADPRTIADSLDAERLLRLARTVVLITSSIHSTEVGGFFTPLKIAYRLASSRSTDDLSILSNTILLLVPSLNPDGVNIVSDWYAQTLGTAAEGKAPPELYHHYAGHDNNRDWYAFTQVETRLVVDSLYGVWHPQLTMDIHQQGAYGSRMFVPPYLDPVEPNVDPILVQGVNAMGLAIAWRVTSQGFAGVNVNASYDAWTPARAFQHYHGAIRILTETASAELATPITVPFGRLAPTRGFDPRSRSWNFVEPWDGGRWTLGDIIRYQSAAAMAFLGHAAAHRDEWLRAFLQVGRRAVRGWPGWPYAFLIPARDQDPAALATLLSILHRGQVEIRTLLAPVTDGDRGESYPAGTYTVVLRQPYASFAKALLERQQYPDLREYPGGPPRPPYDVTAHTLPLLLGVSVTPVADSLPVPLSEPVIPPAPHYRASGLSAPETGTPGNRSRVRVGLYRSFTAPMDEGWTRWIFDTWRIPYESVSDSVVRQGSLGARFDVIVLPSMPAREISDGLSSRRYPQRVSGGLGAAGVMALRAFVDRGGTIIALNEASEFAISALELPVTDALAGLSPREFYGPGSILRIEVDTASAIGRGTGPQNIAWFQDGPAFEVGDRSRVRLLARFPTLPGEVLLSGWLLGAERLAGKGALAEVSRGRGRVVLFGFRPQYRGQSLATFPLLFNAIRSPSP